MHDVAAVHRRRRLCVSRGSMTGGIWFSTPTNEYPARDTVAGYGVRQHGIREQIIMSAKEKQDKKNKIRKTNFRKEEWNYVGI